MWWVFAHLSESRGACIHPSMLWGKGDEYSCIDAVFLLLRLVSNVVLFPGRWEELRGCSWWCAEYGARTCSPLLPLVWRSSAVTMSAPSIKKHPSICAVPMGMLREALDCAVRTSSTHLIRPSAIPLPAMPRLFQPCTYLHCSLPAPLPPSPYTTNRTYTPPRANWS